MDCHCRGFRFSETFAIQVLSSASREHESVPQTLHTKVTALLTAGLASKNFTGLLRSFLMGAFATAKHYIQNHHLGTCS